MFDLRSVDRKELVALKFPNAEAFRKASRLAVRNNVRVEVPGDDTLIMRESDKLFSMDLNPRTLPIIPPEKVSDAEHASLRRRVS